VCRGGFDKQQVPHRAFSPIRDDKSLRRIAARLKSCLPENPDPQGLKPGFFLGVLDAALKRRSSTVFLAFVMDRYSPRS
jgi:hypothetical protein